MQSANTGVPVSKQARVNLLQSFIAVVAGDAVYFLLMPHLPPAARHDPARLDLGDQDTRDDEAQLSRTPAVKRLTTETRDT